MGVVIIVESIPAQVKIVTRGFAFSSFSSAMAADRIHRRLHKKTSAMLVSVAMVKAVSDVKGEGLRAQSTRNFEGSVCRHNNRMRHTPRQKKKGIPKQQR